MILPIWPCELASPKFSPFRYIVAAFSPEIFLTEYRCKSLQIFLKQSLSDFFHPQIRAIHLTSVPPGARVRASTAHLRRAGVVAAKYHNAGESDKSAPDE
jgi:hypothetical protein